MSTSIVLGNEVFMRSDIREGRDTWEEIEADIPAVNASYVCETGKE